MSVVGFSATLAQEVIIKHYKILFLTFKNPIIMSKVNIKPLADRVLVEPAAAEEKTASGLYIPDTAKEKPQKGTVIAVGSGKKDEPLTVKVGDQVLYGKYAGTELAVEGHDYLIMRESDIFAIL
jgi:chaperonin GroES